jgi:glyceraldehyde-3-phosphate dehydrogenase (ferredoxin)
MRAAAKWLDRTYGIKSIDRAVYNAHGESGCMVPNQYWVPGMFSPMPIMGKYFCYYGNEFMPPYELGRKNVERFVYEMYSENGGACRFHRKWVEDIIDDIVIAHYGLKLDYWKKNFDLAKAISDFQAAQSVFWESERTIDVIQGFLEKWQRTGLTHPELANWIERFHQDKWKAGCDFWNEIYRGQQEAFAQGLSEPPHVEHGFIQK